MIEVTYVDHMGSDLSVVNSARVSFGKKSAWEQRVHPSGDYADDVLSERDTKLIKYLAKHKHKSPFNHTFVTFHVKAPIFVARQLVKHEYMPWNEISRRYVDEEPEFYQPDEWRGRSADKKQGSDGVVDRSVGLGLNQQLEATHIAAIDMYDDLLNNGVCPEQARMVLPQSMMTEWYWSGTVFAFAKMCGLRMQQDTQQETREVAMQIDEYMEKLYPESWKALMKDSWRTCVSCGNPSKGEFCGFCLEEE
jgi:thymidylate synthase (FAD)